MMSRYLSSFIFFSFLASQLSSPSAAQTWVKAAYWYADGEMPIDHIDSSLFTHLICAFADVNFTTHEISVPPVSESYFSSFTVIVKRRNPSIKTLAGIWNGQVATGQSITGEKVTASVLSSVLAESANRKAFIESSIKTARRYGFHGIDLFWIWPNATDLSYIGVFLDEWRAAINSEPRNSGEPPLILTMGVRYLPAIGIGNYPIESMRNNLDWAHIIAYDYHIPKKAENVTATHAALYDPSSNVSSDEGIRQWLGRGFPANKLVLGLPYHGWAWTLVNPQDSGVGAPAAGPAFTIDGSMGYKLIRSFIRDYGHGAASVYNATYAVNLFTSAATWINFDGVEAVRAKVAYAKEKGLIGYNAFQISNDDNWALSRAAQGEEHQGKKHRLLLIVLLPVALTTILAATILCYFRSRIFSSKGMTVLSNREIPKSQANISAAEKFGSDAPPFLEVFSFANIKAATDNFSSANKLGEGGYGPVYKGTLSRGQEIAVKRLSKTSTQGFEEFHNEVSLTARLQHVNLVRLLGYCTETEEKMLIYEYMPRRSLDLYIFDPIKKRILDWEKRVHIIQGVTQGLLYLQEYSNLTVIHRDLKPSNVLLDNEMNAKISDFGMARLFRRDVFEANTERIVGTYGYAPPEYVKKGVYSTKYDVYSFGVLLLQIISSKKNTCFYGLHCNLNLLEYAYNLWNEGEGLEFIDPFLDDSSSPCKIMRCMRIALLCVQENPADRPSILEVSSMLKSGDTSVATPKRPAFSVKVDENVENNPTQEIYSFNDAQISELEPR